MMQFVTFILTATMYSSYVYKGNKLLLARAAKVAGTCTTALLHTPETNEKTLKVNAMDIRIIMDNSCEAGLGGHSRKDIVHGQR